MLFSLIAKESEFDKYYKEVIFSLNNSLDNTILEAFSSQTDNKPQFKDADGEDNGLQTTSSDCGLFKLPESKSSVDDLDDTMANCDSFNMSPMSSPSKSPLKAATRYSKRRRNENSSTEKNFKKPPKASKIEASKSESLKEDKEDEKKAQINNNNNTDEILWTEKYQFKNENDIVTNNSQLERLKEWLNNWKQTLSKENQNNSAKKPTWYDSDSEYSCGSDVDSVSSGSQLVNGKKFYSNAILLSGPHGSGTIISFISDLKIVILQFF
jgi:hypothetical protein